MEQTRRFSRKRQAILDVIQQSSCHPTADQVYQQLKPTYPGLSLATVYRNIALFKEQGIIRSVGVVDGLEHFDGDTTTHTHFVCSRCGQVRDLDFALPGALLQQAQACSGGTITSFQLQFYGLCPDCKKNITE